MNDEKALAEKYSIDDVQNLALCNLLAEKEATISRLEIEKRALELQLSKVPDAIRDVINEPSLRTKFEANRICEAVKALTIVQRRDAWLSLLGMLGLQEQLFAMFPHNGNDVDPISILVYGSGGFGDMLYLSSVLPALFARFESPRIVVVHENANVNVVFSKNPYVFSCVHLHGDELSSFLDLCSSIDIFDLIAEVRYAISYIAPPLSRVSRDFLRISNTRAMDYQKYVRYSWPYLNNMFANDVIQSGMTKLDVLGYSGYLAIDCNSQLNYFPDLSLTQDVYSKLSGKSYVTVHHGSDKNMSNSAGVQTKNLPASTWVEIVDLLRSSGVLTVQLGDRNEELIDGVYLDLRGATSFDETACLIKYASVHLDTEGGLVHVARAMNTTSVVMFGLTPVDFFGYKQNINISSKSCKNCWWTTKTWATNCPLGHDRPVCMLDHRANEICGATFDILSKNDRRFALDSVVEYDADVLKQGNLSDIGLFDMISAGSSEIKLIYIDVNDDIYFDWLSGVLKKGVFGLRDVIAVSGRHFFQTRQALRDIVEVVPSGQVGVALDTGCFDKCVTILDELNAETDFGIVADLARCIKIDGEFQITSRSFRGEFKKLINMSYPGNKFMFSDPTDIAKLDGGALDYIGVKLSGKISAGDSEVIPGKKNGPFDFINKLMR